MRKQNWIRNGTYLLLALGLFFGSLIPLSLVAAKGEELAVVAVPGLNLRAGPGLDYKVVTVLSQGQELTLLELSQDGRWYKVRLGHGSEGWVYSQYILPLEEGNAQVLLDGLNLRAGPGFTYRALKQLSKGQEVTVIGRSLQSDWLLLRLSSGIAGWVYYPYILPGVDIASLPVSEASGGPDGSGRPEPRTTVVVAIQSDQAVVDVRGFPASKELVAHLGLPGKSPDLKVANGVTRSDGSARLSFQMPGEWSNGVPVTQDNLVLQVRALDGSASLTVDVVYLTN